MVRGGAVRRFAGALVLLALAACHDRERTNTLQARVAFDREALDFGEVPVGEWREVELSVLNVGFVPFDLMTALGLEGNPSFVVEAEPGDVMPRSHRKVKVRFHPLKEGELTEQLQVRVDATNETSPIPVRGLGTPTPVRLEPGRLDFQTLEVESDRTLTFSVTNPVDLPLTLRLVGADGTPFSTDTVTIPPLATQQVSTRYFPRLPSLDQARLEVRACETCTPATVELQGRAVESAFVFDPSPVFFPATPVHARTESVTRAVNVTWRPVKLAELATSDVAFEALASVSGREVAPGEAVELPMAFAARASGPTVGTLRMAYTSDRTRASEVVLDARGGRPTLALAPAAVDFGDVPVGGKVEAVVRLSNAGTQGDLKILGVSALGDVESFGVYPLRRSREEQYPWVGAWPQLSTDVGIAPGSDWVELRVFFEPTREGTFSGTLVITTDDDITVSRTLTVTGRAYPVGTCTWQVAPQPTMDFGNVPPGWGAVLGFYFQNTGLEVCAVKDIRLADDGGGAFFMPGGELTGGVVPRDSSFSAMVAFRAPGPGSYRGELVLTVNDPANPTVRVPLVGHAAQSCLTAAPNFLDFGPVRYDCSPQPRRTLVQNQCAHPVTVQGLQLGAGTSNQFALSEQPSLPLTLQPGQGFELEATYTRTVHGQHYTPLYVLADGEPAPFLIPMLAETNHEGLERETFVQGTDNQLDVLFVVSNTTTMQAFQDRLRADLPGWLQLVRNEGLDVRVGVTTTGLVPRADNVCPAPIGGGEAGRLLPVDGKRARVVSATAPATVLQQNVREAGVCHNLVQGLETMRQALSSPLVDRQDDPRTAQPNDGNLGLLRAQARLAVVVVSDEDDHSGFDPESYIQFLQALKGPGGQARTSLHVIVPTSGACRTAGPAPASRFVEVARATGGQVLDVCEGSYRTLLDALAIRAAGPQADFHLSFTPTELEAMTVSVDGMASEAWDYDAATNAIVFRPGSVPRSGQRVTVRYRSVCGAGAP